MNGDWTERADPFRSGPPAARDDGYQPFKQCQPGSVMSFDLVPAGSDKHGYEISYFQNWVIRYMGDWMIGILCPSTSTNVFIEGRNLGNLRQLLRQRRVEAIYEYHPDRHGPLPNDAPVVTEIRVEINNDLDAIHNRQV